MRSWRSALASVGLLAVVAASSRCSNVSGSIAGDAGACPTGAGDDSAAPGGGDDGGSCSSSDSDGIVGGCYAFDLTVDDTAFTPIILKAQNRGQVTLTLTNRGSRPHDFVVDCATGLQGCTGPACFPATATMPAVAAGATASTTFVTPNAEGIYVFRSDVSGDSAVDADSGVSGLWGQFVVQ